jgi:hypothetical protein
VVADPSPRCETLVVDPTPVCVSQSFSQPDHFIVRRLTGQTASVHFVIPGVSGPVTVDGYWDSVGSVPATVAIRELGVLREGQQGVFVPSDPLASASASPLPGTAFVLGGTKQFLVTGDSDHVALGLLAGQVPIAGTLGRVDLFLAGSNGTVAAVGTTPTSNTLALFGCSSVYLCSQPLKTLTGQVATLAYARSGNTTVFATESTDHKASVWLWRDNHLEQISELSRYASRLTTSGIPIFSVGVAAATGKPLVVRLTFDPIPGVRKLRSQPSDLLLSAAKNGDWRPIFYAASAEQRSVSGPAGAVKAPWTTHYSVSANPAAIAWVHNHLTALVAVGDSGTLWHTTSTQGPWTSTRG